MKRPILFAFILSFSSLCGAWEAPLYRVAGVSSSTVSGIDGAAATNIVDSLTYRKDKIDEFGESYIATGKVLLAEAATAGTNYTDSVKTELLTYTDDSSASVRDELANAARGLTNYVDSATNGIRNVDGAARVLPKYLHQLTLESSYPEEAAAYYRELENGPGPVSFGMCSARRIGNICERNFDWTKDESAEFVLSIPAGEGRFASLGVATLGMNLSEDVVTSGKWSRFYKCLPGRTMDGVNENGVVVEVNVVVTNGSPWETHTEGDGRDINSMGGVRWVLDHAVTAEDAATNLARRVYISPAMLRQGYSVHYSVLDKTGTYVVEDGEVKFWPADYEGPVVMTNFRVFGDHQPDLYGSGYERYFMLTNSAVSITNAWYSKAYEVLPSGDFPRPTEFASPEYGLKFIETERLQNFAKTYVSPLLPPTRDGTFWQTLHTSVYNFGTKTMRIAVQEADDWYEFSLTPGTDKAKVREIAEEAVSVGKTDLEIYRKVKDIWTWANWDNPDATTNAPDDFLFMANSQCTKPLEFKLGEWFYASQFWPNGNLKYDSAWPAGGDGSETNINFKFIARAEDGVTELFRFGATASRVSATDETVVSWDSVSWNPFIRKATTDVVSKWDADVLKQAKIYADTNITSKTGIHAGESTWKMQYNQGVWSGPVLCTNDYTVEIGDAHATETYAANQSIAIGRDALSAGSATTAVGPNSFAQKEQSIALGWRANAVGTHAISIGGAKKSNQNYYLPDGTINPESDLQLAEGDYTVAIGYNNKARSKDSITIGNEARVSSNAVGAVQIGTGENSAAHTLKFENVTIVKNGHVVGSQPEPQSVDPTQGGSSEELEITVVPGSYTTLLPTNGTPFAPGSEIGVTCSGLRNYSVFLPNEESVRPGLPGSFTFELPAGVKSSIQGDTSFTRLPVKITLDQPYEGFVMAKCEYFSDGSDWTPAVTNCTVYYDLDAGSFKSETNSIEGFNLHAATNFVVSYTGNDGSPKSVRLMELGAGKPFMNGTFYHYANRVDKTVTQTEAPPFSSPLHATFTYETVNGAVTFEKDIEVK